MKVKTPSVRRGAKEDNKNSGGENNQNGQKSGEAEGGEKNVKDSVSMTEDQVKELIETTVSKSLKEHLIEAAKTQAESMKEIIAEALTKQNADSKQPDAASLKALADGCVKAFNDNHKPDERRPAKQVFETGDAGESHRPTIEMPYSWSKGNLTVHAKQLLNLLMNPNMPASQVINQGIDEADLKRGQELGVKTLDRYCAMARRGEKALTSTGSGTGDEFVPTDLASELQRRLFLSSDLAARMAATEIDMPSQPYDYPIVTTRPTFYLESTENTAATASDPGTGKLTLNAKKLMGQVSYSYELDEDSIVPVLNTVQTLLAEAAADAWESALINGDSTATHQDTDTEAIAKAAERAFKGFRKLSLAVTELKKDISSGGINEANLRAMLKDMGKYGMRTRDLVWLVGPKGKSDMMGITNVSTLEKYGPRATILTGELSSFLGIPIIGSERVREDLNASGVDDGVTATKGSINLVNLSRFLTGRRRVFTVEVFRDVKKQQNDIVASFRKAFVPLETPSATIQSCMIGYNNTA